MRSREEIVEMARTLEAQARGCEGGVLRRALSERIRALLWVLQDERVPRLTVSSSVKQLLECLW